MLNIRLVIIALAFVMAVPMVAEAGSYIRKNGSIVAEIDGDYLSLLLLAESSFG